MTANNRKNGVSLSDHAMALLITGLGVPGALFCVLVLIDSLFDLRPLSSSRALGDIASLVVGGGVISVITTPLALTCAWTLRKRLNTTEGTVAKVVTAIAVFGLLAFVLAYANPFFRGS